MAQVTQMVEAYIELAAIPVGESAIGSVFQGLICMITCPTTTVYSSSLDLKHDTEHSTHWLHSHVFLILFDVPLRVLGYLDFGI